VSRADAEDDELGLGCYCHHTCYQAQSATTCNHIEFRMLLSFSLHRAPRRRGREESTIGSRFGPTALSDGTLNFRRTERPRNHVEFVRGEQALGRKRGHGGVEEKVAGAAENEESMSIRKGGSVWIGQEAVIDQGEDQACVG